MALINQRALKQYLALDYNVLFRGPHGVGKTAVIKQVFEEAGLRWKYFSASTLDPWVDFVGVPKVVDKVLNQGTPDEKTTHVLELIRPQFIENDEVEAIFFDELNRAPDKVLNAIMELIQFKSINGHKLKNLKVIWAAINPSDDEDTYSVTRIDPAQLDRFHVHIDVPFKLDEQFLRQKYPKTAQVFIDWWKDSQMGDEIRKQISPRRLDYAIHAHMNNCRLEDFLPEKSNIKKLRTMLTNSTYHDTISAIKTKDQAIAFLSDINNATRMLDMAKSNDSVSINFFKDYHEILPKEMTEPVAEFLYAVKNGKTVYSSLEDLIKSLPDERGSQGTAAIINHADLYSLYASGGSIQADLTDLKARSPNVINRLANHCADVLQRVAVQPPKGSPPGAISTMERILWGMRGKIDNQPTNFHRIVRAVAALDPMLFNTTKTLINKRLYERKIIDESNFLP